ncbi:MAG: methyltransferase family protein [Candidatus Heimdallarchaeota archaeon]
MVDREPLDVFVRKVPDLRKRWKAVLTVVYILVLAFVCAVFFFSFDRLFPYAPIISQLGMAVVVAAISYIHFKKASQYREKYGALAYRYFFYHLMVPYLVTWYACFFHPLFVSGPPLLHSWLATSIGILFLVLFLLTSLHIERSGFHNTTHGMDIYTVFPEEATVVYGEIYAYIRHPLYFSLLCGTIGLAFFRNNSTALITSLMILIPSLVAAHMEDRELVERVGAAHEEYIKNTSLLVPIKHLKGFLKFLIFLDK